ncbi:GNAT family N-acetyltransferase [uncultured Ferrimonas sp.]|uniref:GNAT family N-acetyltransferase n=1 Tax=uncultured Ferrimonas sp. TaxID=432640 RepID=UPI002631422F|nr:GNAT family N-acetyltransferase [uncultured Ferrimonas sp.]
MDYFSQHSERLRYRPVTLADIVPWQAFFEDNDRIRFLGIPLEWTPQQMAEQWITITLERYQSTGLGYLAVHQRDNGAFIGMVGILRRDDISPSAEYEIAYSLLPQYRGQGYATEMARQMRHYGEQQLPASRFISIIHVDNVDSKRVARSNGMTVAFSTEYKQMPVEVFAVNCTADEPLLTK